MFESVELDTWEEYTDKLGDYSKDIKYLSVINLILTRRNLKDCAQFSNAYIAQQTGSLTETVEAIDAINFRPLQQMFDCEDCCIGCTSCKESWRLMFPWTGSTLINVTEMYPTQRMCPKNQFKGSDNRLLTIATSSWLFNASDTYCCILAHRESDKEIRVITHGFEIIPRYIELKSTTEFQRLMLFVRYLCSSARNAYFSEGVMSESDPYYDVLNSNNWKTSPSLLWSNKIENLESRISNMSISRQDAIKHISEKFKSQIESCEGMTNFMERYFPRTSIKVLAAMCLAGAEQPA